MFNTNHFSTVLTKIFQQSTASKKKIFGVSAAHVLGSYFTGLRGSESCLLRPLGHHETATLTAVCRRAELAFNKTFFDEI
jgi:hypothetical protein